MSEPSEVDQIDTPPSSTHLHDSPRTLNVLIVGESQQGKSTLIKQLNRYAEQPDIEIGIGHGNLACTKVVGQYSISAELTRHQLVNPDGIAIDGFPYAELCELDRTEAQVVPLPQEEPSPVLNFSFIDTPGLDDSEGEDFEIMAAIIGRLGELSHVNAVIYVRNINKPFSKSFGQFFEYIQRSLPSISSGLVIVHTCFSVETVAQFLNDSKNLAALRQDAFKAATNLELVHFFMDNEPSKYSPFAILESLNGCHKLLNFLNSQLPIPIDGLQLLKTAKMENYDTQVVTTLMELKQTLQEEWNQANSSKSAKEQQSYTSKLEIVKWKKKLEKQRERTSQLENGPDIVLGSRAVAEDYSWVINFLIKTEVNVGSRRVDYIAECPIAYVSKTTNGGSRWLDENLQGASWSAIITSSAFRDLGGTVTFYTKSRDKHASEIKALRERCADYEDQISYLENTLQGFGGEEDMRVQELARNLERVDALIDTLKMEKFDIGLYKELRRFYASRHRPSKNEKKEFVGIYDEDVATLIK